MIDRTAPAFRSGRRDRTLALLACLYTSSGVAEWLLERSIRRSADDRTPSLLRDSRMLADVVYTPYVSEEEATADAGTRPVLVMSAIVGLVLGVAVRETEYTRIRNRAPVYCGVALWGVGIAIRLWAIATLGDRFSRLALPASRAHTELQTRGPYRWTRHPAYVGGAVCHAAAGLILRNWLSLAFCSVLPIAGRIPRIRQEDHLLRMRFGQSHKTYASHARAVLPNGTTSLAPTARTVSARSSAASGGHWRCAARQLLERGHGVAGRTAQRLR